MKWFDRLDAWGRTVDARWYAWVERRIAPPVTNGTVFVIEVVVPIASILLIAFYLSSLLP